MRNTTFKFLAAYAPPHRLNASQPLAWPGGFSIHPQAWGPERARAILAAAEASLARCSLATALSA